MSDLFHHAQNLGGSFLFNRSVQLPQSKRIQIQFLPFGTVYPASYLCNSNFSHWVEYMLILTIKYLFHSNPAVLCDGKRIPQQQQGIESSFHQIVGV